MFCANVKHITIFTTVWILFRCDKTIGEDICPSESDGQVFWPDTNNYDCVRSNPFCISENMEILSRCCNSEGKWAAAPTCSSYQEAITNPCPDDFDWRSNICIFVLSNSAYPPQCPYEENLSFSEYVSVLDSQVFPIWMPVERNVGDYGLDLMRWMEPTSTYKSAYKLCSDEVCHDYYYDGSITNKNCLIYHNSSLVEAVSCDGNHTAICAYQSLPNKLRSFCSQSFSQVSSCVQSTYSTRSKCFCRGQLKESFLNPKAEFLERYQNLLYSSLNGMCYIGLERANGSYYWKNSNTSIQYSNWAETVVFNDDYKYGGVTSNGWIVLKAENETDCVLYEAETPASNSKIVLDYTDEHFVLKLTNPNSWLFEEYNSMPMVFCFTDASSSALISKLEITGSITSKDEAQFFFQRHSDGPGNYWCNAFLYPDVVAKSSNNYLLRYTDSYNEEYVVILNKTYVKGTNPLSESSIYEYQKLLADQIQSLANISHFHVRIFKIVNVDEDNSQITINFHVANPNQSKSLTYYSTLRDYVEHKLTDFTYVNILDVDNCVGVQTSTSVTWPVVPVNTVTRPREGYCIGSSGFIVNRRCNGNYIDGANWLDLDEPCTVQQFANSTVNLTNILAMNNSAEYMEQVVELTLNNLDLLSQDVELISRFFEQITYSNYINLSAVSIITNQLMEVPKKVLKQSQALSNATDRILYQLPNIIHHSSYIGELDEENLYIITDYVQECNLSAIVVQEDTIYKVFNISNLNEILEIDNAKAAVVLSNSLMSQLLQEDMINSKIIVTIYKNSNLFSEINERAKNTDVIFGVTFPYIQEVTGEILTLYGVSNSEEDVSCSFWDYDLNAKRGYWAETQRSNYSSFVACTYDFAKHFTLLRNEINITQELQTLISSEDLIYDRLQETLTLLNSYYLQFQPIDVQLISELLDLAAQANEENLELVADIINVIIDIPKEVLEQSQKTYNATRKIVYYFDQILQNVSSSQIVERDNLYAVVQFLKEELFFGFSITHSDGKYLLSLLDEQTSSEEIALVSNLDTALLISNDLLEQLLEYNKQDYVPKIAAAVFFKDSLFVEDSCTERIKTKVVGVSFPDFDEYQEGDITLLYNLHSNVPLDYSCAVYPSDTDDSTTIKESWTIYSPSVFKNGFQLCEFWKWTYFSLTDNLVNLTAHLETMLNSTEDIETILKNTSSITRNYYDCLQPFDVFLVAQLLSKVEEISETVLEVCSTIVNNIMIVSSTVLRNSQEIYNATNMILDTFNNIAISYDKTVEVYKDNILLIVSLLAETGMYGIRLENCPQSCHTIILNNSMIFQNATLNKSDVELTLSSTLVNNLLKAKTEDYDPRLVLIIFYNNILFVEKGGTRNTSQIFGIYFPGYDHKLYGEVKLSLELSATNSSDYYNCVSWIFQDESIEGIWSYESRPRSLSILTCNFYEQNFFTLLNGNITVENVTQALESLLNSNISSLAKLYRAQDISYYYMDFLSYDIYQCSNILMQCNELGDEGLDMVSIIINNILRIPQETLLESARDYDALTQILKSVNHISNFGDPRQYSLLTEQFGLVVCQLHSNSSNGVIVTSYDIKCTYEIDYDSFSYSENVVASIILSKEVVAQAVEDEDPKVVVSVFSNNVFFNMEEIQNSTLILGLSISNVQEELEGDVIVLYNSSIYNKTKYDCSFWENLDEWKVINGENLDSFIQCRYSEATYYTLRENTSNNDTMNITQILENIINIDRTSSERLILTLEVISKYSEQFEAYHVYLISIILSLIEKADSSSLETAASIINNIIDLPRHVLADSQDEYGATDWILYHIDRIAETVEDPVKIETQNFVVINRYNISGIYVENCNGNCSVGILFDVNFATLCKNINTALVFDDTLQKEVQRFSSAQVVITVYFNGALFNEECSGTYKNIGPIIGITIPSQSEKFNGSLLFYYYTKTNSVKACASWNYSVVGDSLSKGYWRIDRPLIQPSQVAMCEGKHNTHFSLLQFQQNVTSDLEDILNSNSTALEKLEELSSILSDSIVRLRPVDIYLISKILEYALEEINFDKMNLTSAIVSSLFQVPRNILRESQLTYYATDKILHTVEEMAKGISSLSISDFDIIVQDNFTIAIYDLKETNISGLLLENCSDIQCSISILEGAVNLTDLIQNENLQTAIALSDELLEQVRQSEGSPKMAVSVYFSDVLFNEQSEREGKVSMVCGVLLPGFKSGFVGNLYVLFNTADVVDYNNNSCAFWNFQVQDGEEIVEGSWKLEVDPRNKESFTICEYDHITHFALLLAREDSNFAEANTYNILDIITAVNSILSIIGIIGILLTAALFERWRRNTGNQILVHFSIAMSIKTIMLYVSAGVFDDAMRKIICYVTGAILHYAILSEFCWMLIIGILQFKRFVEVLGGPPKFVLLKACICGWVFPILPVMLILLIDKENYSEGNVGLCYPSGLGLYLGIWLPIIIIVSINFVIFIFIIYNVFHKKTESRDIVNHEILFQWRLALLLFSMLGLTWLFGFLSQIPGAEEIFVYLFCISATLQGFIMFLFFIVFNKSTRFLYSQSIKMWLYAKGYKMH